MLLQDDDRIVTASGDRSACLWDVHRGDIMGCLGGHQGSVKSVRFWERDEAVAVTGGRDGCIRVRTHCEVGLISFRVLGLVSPVARRRDMLKGLLAVPSHTNVLCWRERE